MSNQPESHCFLPCGFLHEVYHYALIPGGFSIKIAFLPGAEDGFISQRARRQYP
jgi:hypothetical protein